jgi:hypothetical protein
LLHEALDDCLQSPYWKQEALHRLGDDRIRPLTAVGARGEIMLADYDWDYRLFAYVLSDGRDMRDLLLADYHIDANGNPTTAVIPRLPGSLIFGLPLRVGTGQPLPASQRAGMITTQWFLVTNTMFSELPRTSAAQAYRAYLGQDIAKGQGIHPVEGEPRDVDNRGVQERTCAACHSTLDPLAYAFSAYKGIEISNAIFFGNPNGSYKDGGGPWAGDSLLFNQPVNDLVAWAEVAAASDEFKRNCVDMFWKQAMGHGPTPDEQATYQALWQQLPSLNYSANALLHALIDTDAFGAP